MMSKVEGKFMKKAQCWMLSGVIAAAAVLLSAGCKSDKPDETTKDSTPAAASTTSTTAATPATAAPATPATPAPVAAPATPATPAPAATPATLPLPIRIKAGSSTPVTNFEGQVFLPEQGFVEGDTVERPDVQIANTQSPQLYRSEHYSMTAFSCPVPNGKYTVKLHFAETFEGITGPGERVFTFNVEGKEFKDFDVWAKAEGFLKAYVETVDVEVTDGKLDITFTPKVENPQICAIEILPRP
jgi:hypothetical protein